MIDNKKIIWRKAVITIYYLLIFTYQKTAAFKKVTSLFQRQRIFLRIFNYERLVSLKHLNFR
jgi:hypothetical protein